MEFYFKIAYFFQIKFMQRSDAQFTSPSSIVISVINNKYICISSLDLKQ